jgi:hypothetical protein
MLPWPPATITLRAAGVVPPIMLLDEPRLYPESWAAPRSGCIESDVISENLIAIA